MKKIIFYDTETTGVRHWQHGIHQISGIVEIDGEVKETFDFNVRPHPLAKIEDEALQVGGVTKEQIMAYRPMDEVYKDLIAVLGKYVDKFDKADKFTLCGYNNRGFDDNFLRAFFVQNEDKYFGSWFHSNTLDVIVLATQALLNVRHEMDNFKLMTVCRRYGIEIDETKLHNSLYDVELTRDLYHTITL